MTLIGQRLEDAGPRDQLRRWYWCGVFGELYGSSTETRFANDLLDMLGWIDDPAGRLPRTVQESNLAPERLESLRTRGSAAYRGLYVMLLRADARDWRTGEASGLQTYYDEASTSITSSLGSGVATRTSRMTAATRSSTRRR